MESLKSGFVPLTLCEFWFWQFVYPSLATLAGEASSSQVFLPILMSNVAVGPTSPASPRPVRDGPMTVKRKGWGTQVASRPLSVTWVRGQTKYTHTWMYNHTYIYIYVIIVYNRMCIYTYIPGTSNDHRLWSANQF